MNRSSWGSNAGLASRQNSNASSKRSVVRVLADTFNNKFDEETETIKLEAEIAEEERPEPKSKLSRLRRKGTQILHSKHVLMMIVLLNVIDCLLVTGELILDIHYIKGILDDSDLQSQTFLDKMEARYPDNLNDHDIDHLGEFYETIYSAKCYWDEDHAGNCSIVNQLRRLLQVNNDNDTEFTGGAPETSDDKAKEAHAHSIWEDIAHGLHKASIAILAVLCLEVLMKIFFMGRKFFHHNIEVFDAIIIIASLILDLVFLKGLTIYRIQDGIFILSFLLPWRVIRVVNSLIVAVLDHEHFRLKMVYKQKKMIAFALDAEEQNNVRLKEMLSKIEGFLEKEGMPRWKYIHYTHFEERNVSIASMATHTLMNFFSSHTQLNDDKVGEVDAQSNNNELKGESLNGIATLENGISHENKPRYANGKVLTSNGHAMHESEKTGNGTFSSTTLPKSWSCTTLEIVEEETDDVKLDLIEEQADNHPSNHVDYNQARTCDNTTENQAVTISMLTQENGAQENPAYCNDEVEHVNVSFKTDEIDTCNSDTRGNKDFSDKGSNRTQTIALPSELSKRSDFSSEDIVDTQSDAHRTAIDANLTSDVDNNMNASDITETSSSSTRL